MKLTTEELREMRERINAAPLLAAKFGTDGKIAVFYDYVKDMPRLLDAYEALEKENERLCEALRYADRAAKYSIAYDAEYVANTMKGGTRDAVDSE